MSERPAGLASELMSLLNQHMRALSTPELTVEPEYVRERLEERLVASGLPPEAVEAVCATFDEYSTQVTQARGHYGEVQQQLDKLRADSARRTGRVTRITPETINGEPRTAIWVEDDFMMLPPLVTSPRVGETVQFARGSDGDALYFGAFGFEAAGLVGARLKRIEPGEDGRVHVELALRDTGTGEDLVVAVASEPLLAQLPQLKEGDRVRVTEGRIRIAFPAPQPDAAAEARANPLFTFFEPPPAAEDKFVYSAQIKRELDQVVKTIRESGRADDCLVPVPQSLVLEGPSGIGKTTVVERHLARELAALDFQCIRVNTSQLSSQWLGESEKQWVQALRAGGDRNSLIVINEVDSLLEKRVSQHHFSSGDVNDRVFAAVADLIGRPHVPGEPRRLLAMTTNFLARLDMALRSRIDETITMGLPDRETAVAITTTYLTGMDLEGTPEMVAETAMGALDVPLVRLVMDGSDHVRTFQASQTLSGRTVQLAVQAAARAAFFVDAKVTAFALATQLKRQLYANLAGMGREDLGVALGVPSEEAHCVTDLHVSREVLLGGGARPLELRMRFRNAS